MADSLSITIDSKALLGALQKAPQAIEKQVRVAIKEGMTEIQKHAKRNHRFTTRSGNAERSIVTQFNASKFEGVVELNKQVSNAPYIVRLHEGGKNKKDSLGRKMTNKPDPFLHNAFDENKDSVARDIEKKIDIAIKSVGL